MNFNDAFEKYRNGIATNDEKQFVESEINKYKKLSEYIYDEEEFSLDSNVTSLESERTFTREVKKNTRKKFLKMGSIIFSILLVIILFVQFGLSPLVSLFYYNPNEIIADVESEEVIENTQGRIYTDMAVFNELVRPLEEREPDKIIDRGYGEYSISFSQGSWASNRPRAISVSGEIVRDKLIMYEPTFLKRNTVGSFLLSELETRKGSKENLKYFNWLSKNNRAVILDDLKDMDKNMLYKVNISFDTYYSFDKAVEFKKEFEHAELWYAARVSKELDEFDLPIGVSTYMPSDLLWDKEKYPNLILDYTNEESSSKTEVNLERESYMKKHLLSMLKYMNDNKGFTEMMDQAIYGDEIEPGFYYKTALDYLEKNPLEIYGMVAYMNKDDIKKALNEDMVLDIQLADRI